MKERSPSIYAEGWMPRKPTPEEYRAFEGSIWQKLGYDRTLCPFCDTHTRESICLNGCHLSKRTQERFSDIMRGVKPRDG